MKRGRGVDSDHDDSDLSVGIDPDDSEDFYWSDNEPEYQNAGERAQRKAELKEQRWYTDLRNLTTQGYFNTPELTEQYVQWRSMQYAIRQKIKYRMNRPISDAETLEKRLRKRVTAKVRAQKDWIYRRCLELEQQIDFSSISDTGGYKSSGIIDNNRMTIVQFIHTHMYWSFSPNFRDFCLNTYHRIDPAQYSETTIRLLNQAGMYFETFYEDIDLDITDEDTPQFNTMLCYFFWFCNLVNGTMAQIEPFMRW